MTGSQKIAFTALAIGAILPGWVFYYWGTSLPWWLYLGLWLLPAGGVYDGLLKTVAAEKIVDRDGKL